MGSICIVTGLGKASSKSFVNSIQKLINNDEMNILPVMASAQCVIQRLSNVRTLYQYLVELIDSANTPGDAILAIPCNSIHVVSNRLQKKYKNFVPIHHATVDRLEFTGLNSKVLLLGTKTTARSRMYQHLLEKHGVQTLLPTTEEQKWLDELIFGKLLCGEFNREDYQRLLYIQQSYLNNGSADHVILACTDLCHLNQRFGKTRPWQTDSMSALVRVVSEKVRELANAS